MGTHQIAGTADPTLYQSERFDMSEYRFDAPAGTYEVTLKFAEIYAWKPLQRIFSVTLEGTTVIDRLDLYAQVGPDMAYDRTFTVTVSDGQINVGFAAIVGPTKISAIRVRSVP